MQDMAASPVPSTKKGEKKRSGRQAGLISALGVCTGYFVHTPPAVRGLSALIHASETLFHVLQYAGTAYLLYLGIKAIRSKSHIELKTNDRLLGNRCMFLTGAATSIMNPKAILFFISYFLHFVVPQSGDVTGQLFVLGTLFTGMCTLVYGMYGFFSGAIGERLSESPRVSDLMRWLTGNVLIGLGVRLALPDKR